ncbi:hypothetical protein BOTCAL_0589g00010 [Botryotinia calthae]|uniref:Uncharacterized protein n=1 Tax=Botryotinia calthae TaxID=38488 RepID=A0A4Y8CLE4_9HELO|nr:hypothetical protein BOTCAL_0589g00010 [Botryotinia calthae]
MAGQNHHPATSQNSIELEEESHHDSEPVNFDYVASYDEIVSPAENAVDEREDEFESFVTEHEVLDDPNENEGENENDGASTGEYCILCRARLFPFYFLNEPNRRRYQEWLSENPAEQWQLKTRAVMNLQLDEHENPVMTKAFVFDSLAVETSLIGQPASQIISLVPRPDLDDYVDTFAYCFHDWCYSVLSWKTKQNSAKFLFELGRKLNTSPVWEKSAEWTGPLYPQIDSNTLLSTADDGSAKLQPLFLSRLPAELRSRIWSYIGSEAAYSAFLLVVGETSHLASQISQPTSELLPIEQNSYIRATFNEIYGTEYIQDLTQDATSSGGLRISQTVSEIDLISSVHGICAIRFSGRGWTSEWLGKIPHTGHSWHGTILVDDTNLLICSHNCIVGVESHFSSGSNFVGSRGEVAVHMSLAPGELVSDVWLRLYVDLPVESVPAVLIQTTLGRECTFGPYVPPDNYGQYQWAMLQHVGRISGFYYENAPRIKRIGVIGDNKNVSRAENQLPRYETRVPEQPYLGNPQFVTDAVIDSLKTVNICRVGTRCVGVFIRYLDPEMSPVTLGQWYVIIFKRSKSGGVVQDIIFSNHDSPELKESSLDVEIKVYEIGTRIVWWSTGRRDSMTA